MAADETWAQLPLGARVELAHASVQVLAETVGADLLHIKGPAASPDLRPGRGAGSDVDVIVRPAHVELFLAALDDHGWRLESSFAQGSSFEHAANYYHPNWGLLDVHRTYPGLERDPAASFDLLWSRRLSRDLAHVPCPVPDRVAESLVLLLHRARTPHAGDGEVQANWYDQPQAVRDEIEELAVRVGADVGLAAALGRLDEVADRPDAALWRVFAEEGSRLDEWRARWRAAEGVAAKAAVLRRSTLVNTYVLAQRLGHEPSGAEVAAEFFRRAGRGAVAAGRVLRTRGRS